MKSRPWIKSIVGLTIFAGIVGLTAWAFMEGRKERAMEQERERPIKPPSRVSLQNGITTITLDQETQAKCGIETENPKRIDEGFLISPSAVVWLDGQAWFYVQQTPDQFLRKKITVDQSTDHGQLIAKGIKDQTRLVIKGAQLLLSEEFRSQIQLAVETEGN